jgi:type I restriction enzyme, S subunit
MNAERLLQYFDRIAEAPDAIPRLRQFILDVAVRGKLVEQDPNDEPAMELLKRIEKEKARFVKEGKIKKEPIFFDKESVLFSLPTSWSWARFVEVAAIESNLVKPDSFPDHPHIAPDNIEGRTGRLLDYQTIRESKVFSAKHRFFPGHIVYSKIRPNLAKAALVDFEGLCSAYMYPIRPFIDRAFLHKFMLSEAFVQQSIKEDNRVAMPKINQESLSRIFVVVPPLAEQHRIVARVDELMALCDQLEAAKTEREQSRDQLVTASLHRLNQPEDAAEADAPDAFRDHARFIFNHLPSLTTRPEHIKQLRQTILNLAVRGKLVRQDPNDEPAAELLKRIEVEKAQLRRERLITGEKRLLTVLSTELPFSTPNSWQWARFIDYATDISTGPFGSILHQSDYVEGGVPLVNPSHMVNGRIAPKQNIAVSCETAERLSAYKLHAGDIVMARRGEVGRAAVVYSKEDGWLCGTGSFFLRFAEEVCREYLMVLLRCEFVRKYLAGEAVGITMVNLNHGILKRMPLPIPPLAEQHRIVAKVDELLALCDQLEAQLSTTEADSRRLLEAVLHEALAPALEETA